MGGQLDTMQHSCEDARHIVVASRCPLDVERYSCAVAPPPVIPLSGSLIPLDSETFLNVTLPYPYLQLSHHKQMQPFAGALVYKAVNRAIVFGR